MRTTKADRAFAHLVDQFARSKRLDLVGLVRRRPPDGRRGRGYELHVIVDVNDFAVPVRHYAIDDASDLEVTSNPWVA